jgi:glyceraldehyde-3-phosphate dehydrogenase (NADP+)
VDRTAAFVESSLQLVERSPDLTGVWSTIGPHRFFIKRAAIGVVLALAPFNYPLNECYATVLPALIMGNIIVLKIPTTGGLVHLKTFAALARHLPPGTIHFVAGSGRATMPAIMSTGHVDALAFIGGSRAADELIQAHPHPHRLKTFLQLEAKNLGIVLPDRRWRDYDQYETVLKPHVDQLVTGALSYNGQRCTAIKLIFVPDNDDTTANLIVAKIVEKVRGLPIGLPWQQHSTGASSSSSTSTVYSTITPLPNHDRVRYLQSLLRDAADKGATIYYGGDMIGGANSTLMRPAVVYPVTPGMRLYTEEQFGPIVAIAKYHSVDDLLHYARHSDHAQQVALFGHDTVMMQKLIDAWGSVYGKICINSVPGRSPDTVPFAGRKSSALGVMSIRDALFEFSVPTVIAAPAVETASVLLDDLMTTTKFLQTTTTAAATATAPN